MINETLEANRAYQRDKDDAYERGYKQGKADAELHCMTVKDMITRLRTKERVEVRDEQGHELFTCDTDSIIWFDYWDREITEWFPHPGAYKVCDFTVYIKDKDLDFLGSCRRGV